MPKPKDYFISNLRILLVLPISLLLLLLSACALNEAPNEEEILATTLPESTTIAETFSSLDELSSTYTPGEVEDGWIKDFGDTQLIDLVEEVLINNQNLQAASAQLDAASALAVQAGAALKPSVGLSASGSTLDASGISDSLETSSAFLNVSWEVDLWGRVRAGQAAAGAAFSATEADYLFARQSLAAQTAKMWFLATNIRAQQRLAQEAVAIYEQLVELNESRQALGRSQPQDLPLSRASLAGAQANLRQITGSYQDVLRSMEVLLGRYPSGDLAAATELTAVPPPIPVGLPSEILERRPDLIAAERRVAAAFFGAEQARAARLPRISLTATAGIVDSGLADLLDVSNPTNLGVNLFAPLYTGGALEAGIEIADAQQRASMAVYTQTVLLAFQEIETALTNEKLFQERETYLQTVVDQSAEAYRITNVQYEAGRVDFLTLLQTQASLLSSRSSLLAIKNDRLSQRVNLHMALGGNFEQ